MYEESQTAEPGNGIPVVVRDRFLTEKWYDRKMKTNPSSESTGTIFLSYHFSVSTVSSGA